MGFLGDEDLSALTPAALVEPTPIPTQVVSRRRFFQFASGMAAASVADIPEMYNMDNVYGDLG